MKVIKIKEIIEKTLNDNKAKNITAIDLQKKSYIEVALYRRCHFDIAPGPFPNF